MELWYRQPARNWCEALPCGNGCLGGMVYGDPAREHIQLNEETVWSGPAMHRLNPDANANLPLIRNRLQAGRIPEAEALAVQSLSGMPESGRAYQTLGDLWLSFEGIDSYKDYRRSLDLENGVLRVEFSAGETHYTREVFASAPDHVLVIRLQAHGPDRMKFNARLTRPGWPDVAGHCGDNSIRMAGSTGNGGVHYCGMLTVSEIDGRCHTVGEFLCVENARSIVLLFAASTGFREHDPDAACEERLQKAAARPTGDLYSRHRKEYRILYGAMSLCLENQGEQRPTDERLQAYAQGMQDPGLEALYFAYGRYLLLSASRPGSLPATLQGIWNDQLDPPWGSRYTININIEMNYWPAVPAGLEECEKPLFEFLQRLDSEDTGKRTAREMYGCRGFVAHHNTDLYADTAPQDQYIPASYWVMGVAWLCTHIWRHYTYTQDIALLERYYPVLEDCVRFFADFLQPDEEGYLVTSPSVSPENTYILPDGTKGCLCEGPTMDNQILRELFGGFGKASKVLGRTGELVETARWLCKKLRPTQIGADGRLLEWKHPYEEAEPGHRHISHLYGLYPGREITPDKPELFAAARRTLETRLAFGGGHTGWSRAWIVGLWARLRDSEKAHENLRALLSRSTFPNLMDSHPWGEDSAVFQIDGNLGATAAMLELLVDSSETETRLLPALPAAWKDGEVRGVRLCGGAILDMSWHGGILQMANLYARCDFEQTICLGDRSVRIQLKAGERCCLNGLLQTKAE